MECSVKSVTHLLIGLVMLAGCSSQQKDNSTFSNEKPKLVTSAREQGLVEMSAATSTTQEALPPVAALDSKSTPNDKLNTQLQDAIQKQDDRSIAIHAREILLRNPQNVTALNALALFYFKKGQIETAKTLLNKALSIEPEISLLHSNLAFIYQSQNLNDEAILSYRQAMKIDPYNTIAASNIGYMYLKRKDYRKAQVAYEIAVEKGQRDWKTLSNYGVTLTALGIYPLAFTQLKAAVGLQSQNIEVNLNYAILLIEHMEKRTEGLEVLNKIRFLGPGPDLRKKISSLENQAKSVLK